MASQTLPEVIPFRKPAKEEPQAQPTHVREAPRPIQVVRQKMVHLTPEELLTVLKAARTELVQWTYSRLSGQVTRSRNALFARFPAPSRTFLASLPASPVSEQAPGKQATSRKPSPHEIQPRRVRRYWTIGG